MPITAAAFAVAALLTAAPARPLEPMKAAPTKPDAGRPSEGFRKEHASIREHLGHIEAMVGGLEGQPPQALRQSMNQVVALLNQHIRAHAEWEEQVLYPAVDRRAGKAEPPFTASMRYEHKVVGRWIDELAAAAAKPRPNARAFMRRVDKLLGLIEAHFEEEEEVLLPILDRTMSQAEFEKEIGRPRHGG